MRFVLSVILVVALATVALAQPNILTTKSSITPVFSSLELMVNCVAQFAMGDKSLLLGAMATKNALALPMGTSCIITGQDGDILQLMVKGQPGVWYTSLRLIGE